MVLDISANDYSHSDRLGFDESSSHPYRLGLDLHSGWLVLSMGDYIPDTEKVLAECRGGDGCFLRGGLPLLMLRKSEGAKTVLSYLLPQLGGAVNTGLVWDTIELLHSSRGARHIYMETQTGLTLVAILL